MFDELIGGSNAHLALARDAHPPLGRRPPLLVLLRRRPARGAVHHRLVQRRVKPVAVGSAVQLALLGCWKGRENTQTF